MEQHQQIHLGAETFPSRHSRRAILRSCGALGLSLLGISNWSRDALALSAVSVAPPTIVRGEDCRATVSVVVTLSGVPRGVRYEVSGDLMESDDPDGDPDFCCALAPQATPSGHEERQSLELIGHVMAADLGLVKGIGPASDETFSPDLVELFARVWLRDLTTAVESGPWDSPLRVAVASTALAWTASRQFPGSELLIPRGGGSVSSQDGASRHLPPLACAS